MYYVKKNNLVKVFQMYYEKYKQELFYFIISKVIQNTVIVKHYFRFPWLLPCVSSAPDYTQTIFVLLFFQTPLPFPLASTQNKVDVPQHMQTILTLSLVYAALKSSLYNTLKVSYEIAFS